MKKTPQLRNLLINYQATLSESEFQSFEREVDRLLNHYFRILSSCRAGAERAQVAQALIDEQVKMNSHIKTSCRKGCGACCHLEVEITEDDADLLAHSILNQNLKIDEDRLQELAERTRLDKKWAMGAVSSNRCILLGADNTCRDYENRPSVCRKHAVTSPAEDCSTLGATPVPLLIPMNEIILSAALGQSKNNFGALPKMLTAALAKIRVEVRPVESLHRLDFKENPSGMSLEDPEKKPTEQSI
jgi:Fe-S-cluster containining protein